MSLLDQAPPTDLVGNSRWRKKTTTKKRIGPLTLTSGKTKPNSCQKRIRSQPRSVNRIFTTKKQIKNRMFQGIRGGPRPRVPIRSKSHKSNRLIWFSWEWRKPLRRREPGDSCSSKNFSRLMILITMDGSLWTSSSKSLRSKKLILPLFRLFKYSAFSIRIRKTCWTINR